MFLVALASCVRADPSGGVMMITPTPSHALQLYLHPSGIFSLRLPADWSLNDLSTDDTQFVEFSPPGAMRALLTVYITNMGTPLSVETLEQAIAAHQASRYSTGSYHPQERAVQVDGSWLVPAVHHTAETSLQLNTFYQRSGAFFVVLEAVLPEDPDQLRTLDQVIDTLAVDPNAAGSIRATHHIEAPAQEATGTIAFDGMYTWTDTQGVFYLNGQVTNQDVLSVEFVRITARLFDAVGDILAEESDFAAVQVLAPGEAAPFSVRFPGGRPAMIVRYELHASARHAVDGAPDYYGPSNFVLEDRADYNDQGHLVIGGTVTNIGSAQAKDVKIVVTIFDGQGRVVAAGNAFGQQSNLAPEESTDYQLTFFELGGEAVHYVSKAGGVRQP